PLLGDLGLGARVVRLLAPELGRLELVRARRPLDLRPREVLARLLGALLGALELLLEALAVAFDLLELDAQLLDLAAEAHDLARVAARAARLEIAEQARKPPVLFVG